MFLFVVFLRLFEPSLELVVELKSVKVEYLSLSADLLSGDNELEELNDEVFRELSDKSEGIFLSPRQNVQQTIFVALSTNL